MKKLFFAAISLVCLMACSQDETLTPIENPISGQDVLFTSTMGEASRTLYAEEYANSIAVKWVDGDLISVYGVDCGLKQADYEVTGASGTENGTPYYYAASLDKTAESGVQWGDAPTSDFYAVYPSTPNSFRNNGNGSVTVKTTVRAAQRVAFEKTTNAQGKTGWVAKHFQTTSSNPTMTDAVMYAAKKDAAATNADGTPKAVDLKFNPFSTVLRFTMQGYQAHYADGTLVADKDSELAVTRIVLTAPNTKIAGDFDLTIKNDGTATASEGTTNQITLYPEYLPLKNQEWIQFDVFTIPQEGVVLPKNEPWTVLVETTLGNFTYKLIPTIAGTETTTDAPLKAGSLHKLSIPLKEFTYQVEIGPEEWMKYVPRNVYISELSYPGGWYCTDGNYQDDTSIASQWSNGARAFHIDCRMSPSSFKVDIRLNKTYGPLQLVCTGTDKWGTGGPEVATILYNPYTAGTPAINKLKEIANQITEDEFAVVVLTIAEKPLSSSGNVYGGATVAPATVLAEIKKILNENATALKLYTNTITPTTTLNELLGHMVVKVNANAQESKFTNYTDVPSTLISAASMASDGNFISGDIFGSTGTNAITDLFTAMQVEPMYWGKTAVSPAMNFYYHQAQLTDSNEEGTSGSSTPSLYDRKKAIDDIVSHADDIYYSDTYAWYQIGAGGYVKNSDEDHEAVSNSLNAYIKGIVDAKLNQTEFTTVTGTKVTMTPSPLGIVLMNHITGTNGKAAMQAILEMNKKFYLNRNHDDPEWPNGSPFQDMNQGSGDDTPGSGGEDPTPDEWE
ncbi:MAG: hypothetical protein IKY68_02025 [Alistipes sp.]|nr:hypothetical protein [Alistipes sp.]